MGNRRCPGRRCPDCHCRCRCRLFASGLNLEACLLAMKTEPVAPLPVTCLRVPLSTSLLSARLERQALRVMLQPLAVTAFLRVARDTRWRAPLLAMTPGITLDMLGFRWVLEEVWHPVPLLLGSPDVLACWTAPRALFEAKGPDGGGSEVSFFISSWGQ